MLRYGATLLLWAFPAIAVAQDAVSVHTSYETYAAGMHIAAVEADLRLDPRHYQISLGYHTVGLAGIFAHGHQHDVVSGDWLGLQASPLRFVGEGMWRGINRLAVIDYQGGQPIVRQLLPANDTEREPVPQSLRMNTIDTLSALAVLVHVVAATGRCETAVRTYDGRRVVDIAAHTGTEEVLPPSDRSSYAGKALRCDFTGRMLAGFLFGDDKERDGRPMHGSAWLASLVPNGPLLPVRMSFETRWFGDATMYLTGVGPASDVQIARGN